MDKNTKANILQKLANAPGAEAENALFKELAKVEKVVTTSNDYHRIEEAIALESTGVVHGEYGFAQAHAERKAFFEDWLKDSRPKVKKFGIEMIADLEAQIEHETKRADEQSALGKYKWGE